MVSIFISHSWDDSDQYLEFVTILDQEIGANGWRNVSIPKSTAVELVGSKFLEQETELDRLEKQLIMVEADMCRPGLSTSTYRATFDRNGKETEIETKGTLERKASRLRYEIDCFIREQPVPYVTPPEYKDTKSASAQIRLHPELSLAIRERILLADYVFVLVTPSCWLRRWIAYEIAACAGTRARVVAVEAGGTITNDFKINCHAIVRWNSTDIVKSLLGQKLW